MDTERYVLLDTIEKVNRFVNKISLIKSDVDIIYEHYTFDAKSLMTILSIPLNNAMKLIIHSDDEDEIRKFNEIAEEYK